MRKGERCDTDRLRRVVSWILGFLVSWVGIWIGIGIEIWREGGGDVRGGR